MNFLGDTLKKGDVIQPVEGNREFPSTGWTKRFSKGKNATYNPNQTR